MRRRVVVNDTMQQDYVYFRTEPMGRNFHPLFRPELTPKQMLRLGVFGGKYMTDCRDEFPASWFAGAKLSPGQYRLEAELFRRQGVADVERMAAPGLDPPAGSARVVPVVLPLLQRTAIVRRPPPDPALARDRAARRRDPPQL